MDYHLVVLRLHGVSSQMFAVGRLRHSKQGAVFQRLPPVELYWDHLSSNDSFPKIVDCNRVESCVFLGAPTEAQMNRCSSSTCAIKTIE